MIKKESKNFRKIFIVTDLISLNSQKKMVEKVTYMNFV